MSSPLLCLREEKAALEAKNSVRQLDLITHWIERGDRQLRVSHILELQATAVENVYPCAGRWRDAFHRLEISDGHHSPPAASSIEGHIVDLLELANNATSRATGRAALILWRLNWIHPFNGGNGRTARAAAYFLLAADLGFMPPGNPSLPGLIKDDRDGYLNALRACDAAYATQLDLAGPILLKCIEPMHSFVATLYMQQLIAGAKQVMGS